MAQQRRQRQPGGRARGAPLTKADLMRAAGLKQFRENSGLSQTELAKRLGVSQSSLTDYENGRTRMPDDVFEGLLEIAKAHAEGVAGGATPEDGAALGDGPPPAGPGDSVPPAGGGDTPPQISHEDLAAAAAAMGAGVTGLGAHLAASMELSAAQATMAENLTAFYQLLGAGLAELNGNAGAILFTDSPHLAKSAVLAAEESPFLKRVIELLSAGPMFTFGVLHLLTVMKIQAVIREEMRQRKELAVAAASVRPDPVVPMPPQHTERLDPLAQYRQVVDPAA